MQRYVNELISLELRSEHWFALDHSLIRLFFIFLFQCPISSVNRQNAYYLKQRRGGGGGGGLSEGSCSIGVVGGWCSIKFSLKVLYKL